MSATQMPNNFRCPISLKKMTDPVVLPSGHTFDRSSIQKWLKEGNRTCPMTGGLLPDRFDLISNHSLRSLISDYTSAPASGSRPDPGPEPEPGALVVALACGEMSATQMPNNFLCPISLKKMTDPVVLPSGHTFDRSAIQKWLDEGNRTCPTTGVLLPDTFDLISNHSLRSLISDYTSAPASGSRPDPGPEPEPGALVDALASCATPPESKRRTLARLIQLSKDNLAFCRQLTESGITSVVLSCVDSDNGLMRESALRLLLNLSFDDDNKVGLVKEGAVSKIVGALTADSANCRALAAEIINKLAAVEDNQATIGENPLVISGLNSLLKDGSGREKEKAVMALLAICSSSENKKGLIANGSVPVLIKAADSGIECAVEVLAKLVKLSKAREEMEERCDKCVRALVQVLKNGNKRVQYALSTLHTLCCSSEKICVEVRKFGVLEMCNGFKKCNDKKIGPIAAGLANLLKRD